MARRAKPRRGRPSRAGKAATERIELRVTKLNKHLWSHAAALEGISVSEWLHKIAEEKIAQREESAMYDDDDGPCKHCVARARAGLDGQCPTCANDRARAELADERKTGGVG